MSLSFRTLPVRLSSFFSFAFRGMVWRPYLIRYLFPLVLFVTCSCIFAFVSRSRPVEPVYDLEAFRLRPVNRYVGSFSRDFCDLNDVQLEAARRIGISPIKDRESLSDRLSKLREIPTSDVYLVDDLSHSVPYLVLPAAELLEEIGERFRAYLSDRHLPLYRPIVTSVTRTLEDVRSLRTRNSNTSPHSTHAYGTTFDISWKRFDKVHSEDPREMDSRELKHILAIVLRDLRRADRCYIKHERNQACFHITVRQ